MTTLSAIHSPALDHISPEAVGYDLSGNQITRYHLFAKDGISVRILNLGATITELLVPSAKDSGEIYYTNVVLGFNQVDRYKNNRLYVGAMAGRYCNRIAQGELQIGDLRFELDKNEGKHHLHGGADGYHSRIWETVSYSERELVFRLVSEDGDQGYPGKLEIELRYLISDSGTLEVHWRAISDQETVVSLTQHSYFNLAGFGQVYDHYLRIPSQHYTPVDSELIPTGEISLVEGTVYDFQSWRRLGDRLEILPRELLATAGFDHNWAINSASDRQQRGEAALVAELYLPENEISLAVSTTQPGLHFYSGNDLEKVGLQRHAGICLESQYYPDSPNQATFPSAFLKPNRELKHHIEFKFGQEKRAIWSGLLG